MSVWFVTGASRGLGAAITREVLERGHSVAAAVRNLEAARDIFKAAGEDGSLLLVSADITDQVAVDAAVRATLDRFGRIDVLVNNAGRGLIGAVEEVSDAGARALFDTNVFGLLNVQRSVLPAMRKERAGSVITIGSIGGFTGSPGWGLYNATKFALEGLCEAMHAELAPLGIKVTIVEPGGFRTDFLDATSLHIETNVIDDYAPTAGETRTVPVLYNRLQRGDPAKLAATIADLADADDPPLRLQLGPDSVERVERKLEETRRVLKRHRELAMSTDLPDGGT